MGERRVYRSLNKRRIGALLASLSVLAAGVGLLSRDGQPPQPDCPPITARVESVDGGVLAVRVCGVIPLPLVGAGLFVRYDLQIRVGWLNALSGESIPKNHAW